jgi:deoxyribose-phosphate aldolase
MARLDLARFIGHTCLKPEAQYPDIEKLCAEARRHHFASVCVNPTWVSTCRDLLVDSDVRVCTVVGFPLGANTTATKVFETETAIHDGATEVDMVIAIGRLKQHDIDYVRADIAAVVETAHRANAITKVILETSKLTDDEIVLACQLAVEAKVDFVKTSTGFGGGGATAEHVSLMKATVLGKANVKASGGVSTFEDAVKMVAAGATRIGTSKGVAIMEGMPAGDSGY